MSLSARRIRSFREPSPPPVAQEPEPEDSTEDASHECQWCLGDERECLGMCRDDPDPVYRPRTQEEIEDAAYDVYCPDCGIRLGDDDEDWPGYGTRCPECASVAAELAEEDCAESESCAPTKRTGT